MSGGPSGSGVPAPARPGRGVVVGVGASKGVPAEEVLALVEGALREAGVSAAAVAGLATVTGKAGEPGIAGTARRLGVPVMTYDAGELARVRVPGPSGAPLAAVGTPSVAEAAALLGGGELLVPKRKSARATCAVATLGGDARPHSPTAPAPTGASAGTAAVAPDGDGLSPHGPSHAH